MTAVAFVAGFVFAFALLGFLCWLENRKERRESEFTLTLTYDPHDAPDWSGVTVPLVMPEELPADDLILEPPYPPGSRVVRDDHPFDL